MQLRGAVVVVTGASSGIGEATAQAFARKGSTVVLAARRAERLEELAAQLEKRFGVTALAVKCDVTDPDEIRRLPAVVREAFGRCDVLVNNAGVPGGGRFENLTYDQIEEVVRTNLLGVMLCTKAFLPLMQQRHRGHIVNIASLAGRFATPGASVYTATKHGVVAFSEALYHELRPGGVLVTAVNPGFVATEGFPQARLPARMVMKAERVAGVVVDVVRSGRGPEVSVPRWVSPLQAFRVLTPSLYRWGVGKATAKLGATGAKEG